MKSPKSNHTQDQPVDFGKYNSAESAAISAIEEMTEEIEILVTGIVGKIGCYISAIVNAELIKTEKVARKVKAFVTRTFTKINDEVTKLVTPVVVQINDIVQTNDWQLKQILIKAGKIQPNQDITADILVCEERKPDPSFIGTVNLDIGALKSCLCDIVEVLREIRDRIPGIPVEYAGEEESEEEPKEYIKAPGVAVDIADLGESAFQIKLDNSYTD